MVKACFQLTKISAFQKKLTLVQTSILIQKELRTFYQDNLILAKDLCIAIGKLGDIAFSNSAGQYTEICLTVFGH